MSMRIRDMFGPPDMNGFQEVLVDLKWGREALRKGQKVRLERFELVSEYKDDARAQGDTKDGVFHMNGHFVSYPGNR